MPRERFRWLPQRRHWGLLLFAIFIGDLFLEPYERAAGALEWTLTALGVSVFLGLFVAVFVLRGHRLLWIVAGDILLGVLFAPFNTAAAILFIYAASFVPFALRGKPWRACAAIGVVVAIIGVESWLLRLPPSMWAVGIGYSLIIGAANVWTSQQSIASERLRLAHDEIEHLAKIAERERIARDLHDVLGHTLSVIILKAELASRLMNVNPAQAHAEIATVERVSREALEQVREAVRGYRTRGLLAEIDQARSVLEDSGIVVECRSSAVTLTPAQDNVLALALREAVTNVIRHADATRCWLVLEEQEGTCRLTVHDDGRGGEFATGLGLRGLSERVAAIGGSAVREDKAGVRLTITIPVSGVGSRV